jgi:NAD(P)-dependent dehydrogenase (short-subunit alcohol dehydrogenase family)
LQSSPEPAEAWVAGAAVVLGEAGATVYVTGRSVAGDATTGGVPGTIDETAEAVTARGGKGIAVRCDHTVDADVDALFNRVQREQGRLDLLVNCAWGGYEQYGDRFQAKFWEQPVHRWDSMFTSGVRPAIVAGQHAAQMMIPQKQGLIVNITAWDRDIYLGNIFYDLAKNAANRMAFGMAKELKDHNVAAVALAPGFIRTERVVAAFEAAGMKNYENFTESPEYAGRAIAALAADPDVMRKSGQTLTAGDLAMEYGFTDVDGRRIPALRMPDDWP